MKEEEEHLIYRASPLYSIKQNFNERTKQDQISMVFIPPRCAVICRFYSLLRCLFKIPISWDF